MLDDSSFERHSSISMYNWGILPILQIVLFNTIKKTYYLFLFSHLFDLLFWCSEETEVSAFTWASSSTSSVACVNELSTSPFIATLSKSFTGTLLSCSATLPRNWKDRYTVTDLMTGPLRTVIFVFQESQCFPRPSRGLHWDSRETKFTLPQGTSQ